MNGAIDPSDNEARPTGCSPTTDLPSDASPASSVEGDQAESLEEIREALEQLAKEQSAAFVYFDQRSTSVTFNRGAHITGDVVGGDQGKQSAVAVAHEASKAVAGSVPEEELAKAGSVQLPPSRHARARAVLREEHMLVLWGPARWGKWTAALHFLQEMGPGRIVEIKPDVTGDELLSMELGEGESYVLDSLPPEAFHELIASDELTRLSTRMRTAGGYVVITVPGSAPPPESELLSCVVNWNELPEPRRALESGVRWRLGEEDLATALALAGSSEIQHLLEGRLLPRELDQLAAVLARVAKGELDLEEGLSQFEKTALSLIEEWFTAHTDSDEQAFMICVAVLNGSEYDTVASRASALASHIRRRPGEDGLASDQPPLTPRSSRLEEAHARIAEGIRQTEFGSCPVETVVLDNPAFQACVLRHVWRELDRLRAPLLEWLTDLSQFPTSTDRAKAAAAVGELSKLDFVRVTPEAIKQWADSSHPQCRAAAASALGIPAWNSEQAPRVMRLLHHWGTLQNNWRLRWTAAAAYGGLAGRRFPNVALRELVTLASCGDSRLRPVAASSLARLLESLAGEPSACLVLLSALVDATDPARSSNQAKSTLVLFLELLEARSVSADSEARTWPVLLRAVHLDITCRAPLVSLWRRALKTKAVRRAALGALRIHLEHSQEALGLRDVVEGIVSELVMHGTDREANRIVCNLSRWASDASELSNVARHLLNNMKGAMADEGRLLCGRE